MAAKKKEINPMKGFRKTGSFIYEGKPVDILINSKTGMAAFEQNGKLVEDQALQDQMMKALLEANKISG